MSFRRAESSLTADAYDRADAFYRQALARDPNLPKPRGSWRAVAIAALVCPFLGATGIRRR